MEIFIYDALLLVTVLGLSLGILYGFFNHFFGITFDVKNGHRPTVTLVKKVKHS